jgi:hypothetical protein
MLTDQWKPRDVVIERRNLAPTNLSVTLLAAAAQPSVVSVILLVTPYAGRCQLLAIELAGMAHVALDLCVGESKREFRLIVIEVDANPLVLIVAGLAFPAISTGVDVLNSVAFDARRTEILVAFAKMACGARDSGVRTHKRKLRLAVIEWLDSPPGILAMTIITPLSKAPFMRITGLVAIEAASRRIAKLDCLHVTAIAAHCLMRPLEFEVRGCVIECFPIKLDDVGRSPLVIGMAVVAFL